jgi:xylulokinase
LGVGGLKPGAVTVVAGSSTPLQLAADEPTVDSLRHPWVSVHLLSNTWAVETNAGYPGMFLDWLAAINTAEPSELADAAWSSIPGAHGITATVAAPSWDEGSWRQRPPAALIGFEVRHSLADVARAVLEAHAFGIRANLEDLERVRGLPIDKVILTGGASKEARFCALVSDVCGRRVLRTRANEGTARAGAAFVSWALGNTNLPTAPDLEGFKPDGSELYEKPYRDFLERSDHLCALSGREGR